MKKSVQIAIAFFLAIFTTGMIKGYIKEKDKQVSEEILKVLKNNCNCKDIQLTDFAYKGFTSDKAYYQLTDCNYISFDDELKRIEQLLKDEVKGIKDFNLITLDFVSNSKHKTVTIENGKLQHYGKEKN